jgi:predicted DNA-binding transcriptional regulator YafY
MTEILNHFREEISTLAAAEKYNLTPSYVARLARLRIVQARKAGRDWIIDEEALRKYLENPRKPGPKPQAVIGPSNEENENLDRLHIFEVLAQAWATHRYVRLHYAALTDEIQKYDFAPYLLIASYTVGSLKHPKVLRTFKLERIRYAKLTEEIFQIPAYFEDPAFLHTWGIVTIDEEPVEVRLRFSPYVAKRVKETMWHLSQQIVETPGGDLIWTAQISNTLEIESWIRRWGADCEVLTPQELREKMMKEVNNLAALYGITPE